MKKMIATVLTVMLLVGVITINGGAERPAPEIASNAVTQQA